MAFSLPRFIRGVAPESLRAYLRIRSAEPADGFDWAAAPKRLVTTLANHVFGLPPEQQAQIFADLDRVDHMSDDVGERCLLDSMENRDPLIVRFQDLESYGDRVLDVFVHEPAAFERAELLRVVETGRETRLWTGFLAAAEAELRRDVDSQEALRAALRGHFQKLDGSGRRLEVDIFDRRRTLAGSGTNLVQVMVYVEGLPQSGLVFEGEGVTRATRRPAIEVAWTYAPETGELEVLAKGGREVRAELARLFMAHLLGADADPRALALRSFELDRLRSPMEFATDAEDHIARVTVRRLRLRPLSPSGGALVIERDARGDASLHDLSARWFRREDPLSSGFRVNQARLSIEFQPVGDRKRGSVVTFDLTWPNGSTLKNHIDHHRLITEKYLARWGLLQTV